MRNATDGPERRKRAMAILFDGIDPDRAPRDPPFG